MIHVRNMYTCKHVSTALSAVVMSAIPCCTSTSGGNEGAPPLPPMPVLMAMTLQHTSFLAACRMDDTVRGVMSVERMKSRTAS